MKLLASAPPLSGGVVVVVLLLLAVCCSLVVGYPRDRSVQYEEDEEDDVTDRTTNYNPAGSSGMLPSGISLPKFGPAAAVDIAGRLIDLMPRFSLELNANANKWGGGPLPSGGGDPLLQQQQQPGIPGDIIPSSGWSSDYNNNVQPATIPLASGGNPFYPMFWLMRSRLPQFLDRIPDVDPGVMAAASGHSPGGIGGGFGLGGFPGVPPGFPGIGSELGATVSGRDGNTTSKTKVVNGHRITINETVYGNPYDGSVFKVRVVDVHPEKPGTVYAPSSSEEEDQEPEQEVPEDAEDLLEQEPEPPKDKQEDDGTASAGKDVKEDEGPDSEVEDVVDKSKVVTDNGGGSSSDGDGGVEGTTEKMGVDGGKSDSAGEASDLGGPLEDKLSNDIPRDDNNGGEDTDDVMTGDAVDDDDRKEVRAKPDKIVEMT